MKLYKFPKAKYVVVSGDIHGDFNRLVFKMCVQYQMRDTLLIVAGDCGFGFESRNSYEDMAKQAFVRSQQLDCLCTGKPRQSRLF